MDPSYDVPPFRRSVDAVRARSLGYLRFSMLGFVLLHSMIGCSEDIIPDCSIPYDCPPFAVYMDYTNACVDSASVIQVRLKAYHEFVTFPDRFRWMSIPTWFDTSRVESLGGLEYCLTLEMQVPEGLIDLGDSVSFTAEFDGGYQVLLRDAVFFKEDPASPRAKSWRTTLSETACDAVPPCDRGAGLGVLVDFDLSMGLVLQVFNAAYSTSVDPLTLSVLEWTAAPDTIPVEHLVWGNTYLESLPWTSPATNLPVTLLPGQAPLVYDIPDSEVASANVVLVRTLSASQTVQTKGIAQKDLRESLTGIFGGFLKAIRQLRNYPDPFTFGTTIEYELEQASRVVITIYNVRGQCVARIERPSAPCGLQRIAWDGLDEEGQMVPPGVYFYRLQASGVTHTEKMVILR